MAKFSFGETMHLDDSLNTYLDAHFDTVVEDLRQWLHIPSISTLPEHLGDVAEAARWAVRRLTDIGFPEAAVVETSGHPLVLAKWVVDPSQPTLLIYGHYDVQPVDPLDQWLSPPFEATIRDGYIYGRGASDDKGQIVLVLAALEAWAKVAGGPPINITLLLEGEEEAGGEAVARFVSDHLNLLAADTVLICDTHMVSAQQPSLIVGLRGILCAELTIRGAKSDLHSGGYGGIAPNPLHALCLLLARLKGEDGRINIAPLAARIPQAEPAERRFWQEDPLDITKKLLEEMGVGEMVGENEYPPLERVGIRPTLEVHGICGGFTGAGSKTVIPAEATAKISMRLSAGLDPEEVYSWLEEAARAALPRGYRLTVRNLHGGKGISISADQAAIKAAGEAVAAIFATRPVLMREGGSIPIAAQLHELLQVPVVLLGFGLPDDAVHAPNERFSLDQLKKGMKTIALYLGLLRQR
jgi:acetylornithine deacetylase/succinyl-diaminopimelate desuccinylase-like protein